MDDVPENSADLDVTTSEEPSLEAPVERYKYDEWIYQGLSTIDEDNRGNGRDIDGIANYILEKHQVGEIFKERLIEEVEDLVATGQIVKIGDRYKVSQGYFESDEAETSSPEATHSKELTSTLTQTSSEGSPESCQPS